MKLVSWNVNGIRAMLKKDHFLDDVKDLDADVLCLQETKAHPDQVDEIFAEYPHHFWNAAEKKGYSGTAIFSRAKPKEVTYGIGVAKHDTEDNLPPPSVPLVLFILLMPIALIFAATIAEMIGAPGIGMLKFLGDYQAQFVRTQQYCQKLKDLELLEPMQAQMTLPGGEKRSLGGFFGATRAKVKELDPEKLKELCGTDELELTYLQMASLNNLGSVIGRSIPKKPADVEDEASYLCDGGRLERLDENTFWNGCSLSQPHRVNYICYPADKAKRATTESN